MADGTAVNEKAFASTLSPGCTPTVLSAMKSPEPAELKPTEYLKPVASHMSASAREVSERTPGVYRNSAPVFINSRARCCPASGIGSGIESGLLKVGPLTPFTAVRAAPATRLVSAETDLTGV